MRKTPIFALMLLSFVHSVSHARTNWIRLGENSRAEIFIDTASIERPPGYVKIWTMLSFKSMQRGGWLSERRLFMFACKDRSLEWQQSMYHAERMGDGEFVHARSLNRYGVGDLRLVELDPSTKDKSLYKDAVPESEYISVFKDLC